MTLMSLGMFVFQTGTLAHQELSRRRSWRHARSGRVGALDAVQFTGRDNDQLSLSGQAPAELCAGRASIDQLVAMAAEGQAWPLLDGAGLVYGDFVITDLDETQRHFFADGTPRMIEFRLALLEVEPSRAPA